MSEEIKRAVCECCGILFNSIPDEDGDYETRCFMCRLQDEDQMFEDREMG